MLQNYFIQTKSLTVYNIFDMQPLQYCLIQTNPWLYQSNYEMKMRFDAFTVTGIGSTLKNVF